MLSHFPPVVGPQAPWLGFMEFLLPAVWSLKATQSGLRDHRTERSRRVSLWPTGRTGSARQTFSGIILCNFLGWPQSQPRGEQGRGSGGGQWARRTRLRTGPPFHGATPRQCRVLRWGGLRALRDTSPNAADPGRCLENKGTQGRAGAKAAVCVRSILGLVSR